MDNDEMSILELIETQDLLRGEGPVIMDQIKNGELVVLYEAIFQEAEGVLNAETVEDTSRPMLVRQVTDLNFVPNSEWATICVTAELWAKAKGRDTIMWNMCFPEGNKNDQ